jgi:hypothetical protein
MNNKWKIPYKKQYSIIALFHVPDIFGMPEKYIFSVG